MRFIRNNPLAVLLIIFIAAQSYINRQGSSLSGWFMDILITLPAILIGLSFHEFAHAIAADLLGDKTPRLQGRVTINPVAHVDPFGLVALIFIGFGWGRPVMVDSRNFKHIRRDGLIVDLAGVSMNLILAVIFAGILRLLFTFQPGIAGSYMGGVVIEMLMAVISINIVLMIFNLLPIPPLDGFGILTELFDLRRKDWYYQVYNNGFMFLLILMIFNVTDKILVPAVHFVYGVVIGIFF